MADSKIFQEYVMRFWQFQRLYEICCLIHVFKITKYKSQITNKLQTTNYKLQTKRCPSDNFKRLRRGVYSGIFKPERAVCNFGHCNLGFVIFSHSLSNSLLFYIPNFRSRIHET